MVTAQRQPYVSTHATALALAPSLRRPIPAEQPQVRPMPRSRRREYQAWMTLLIVASGFMLAFGVLSLYGRICQTSEINRRCSLNVQLRVAQLRGEGLTMQRAQSENDVTIAAQAARLHMVRRTDSDAVTIP